MPLSGAAGENLLEPLKTVRVMGQPWPWSVTSQQSWGRGLSEVLGALEVKAAQPVSHALGSLSTICTPRGLSMNKRWLPSLLFKAARGVSYSPHCADTAPLGHGGTEDLPVTVLLAVEAAGLKPRNLVSEPEGCRKHPMEG